MNDNEIQTLLADLCREMESLWALTSYKSNSYSGPREQVITNAESGTHTLPKTGRPIRGIAGVEVSVREPSEGGVKARVYELVSDSILPQRWLDQYRGKDELEMRERLGLCADALFGGLAKVPDLTKRISESVGYKHYEPEELTEWISNISPEDFRIFNGLFISRVLSEQLVTAGFDPATKAPFSNWEVAVARATEKIFEIAARKYDEYEVVIFLNAPAIDEEDTLPLAKVGVGIELDLSIRYADDELLTKLHRANSNAQLRRINTAVSFWVAVSESAPVDSYLNVYVLGARVAERLVDCLRLIRDEDIGVMALEVFRADRFVPAIRKTYEEYYQSGHAPYVPKRFSFEVAPTPPLSGEELARLRALLSAYADVNATKGPATALQRFRSSCERYLPWDPERLLDMAFAFEAIFLNDGDNKELSYRLSLRMARFLGNTPGEREEIFEAVKNLYNMRSKIAHGETLATMKPGDAERLTKVLARAPKILRDALIRMLLGEGPKGLVNNETLGKWWRGLELG